MSDIVLTDAENAQLLEEAEEVVAKMNAEDEDKAKQEAVFKEYAEREAFEKSASEKYINSLGDCPVCNASDDLHAEPYEPEDDALYASRKCHCSNCGSSWIEALKVTEIFSITKGDLRS